MNTCRSSLPKRRAAACVAGFLCAIPFAIPEGVQAQLVSGTVREREGGAPVASAGVTMIDTLDAEIASASSGPNGAFRLSTNAPGLYRLRVESMGYATAVSETFTLEPLEELRVDLFLSPEPIGLAPLEVLSRRRPLIQNVMLRGFVERREKGWGRFLTREQIEERDVGTVASILRTVPGVTVVRHPNLSHGSWYLIKMNRAAPALRSLAARSACVFHPHTPGCAESGKDPERLAQEYVSDGCPPVFYVDGGKIHDAGYVSEILNMIPPSQIEAIEVYRGAADTPGEFGGTDARCGVVVIWTRRSDP